MFKERLQNTSKERNARTFLLHRAARYLSTLEQRLDLGIDKRLVRTFYDLFIAILIFRHTTHGLLLSELGAYICGPAHAPAGTKRISNLLRSKKWTHRIVDTFLFERTSRRVQQIKSQARRPLLLWDDSRIEKPESWFVQGLCSVFSTFTQRRMKIKRGFYSPPMGRVCVPGFKWTAVMLSHIGGVPSVCQMSWWTTRGKFKEDGSNIVYRLLMLINSKLGRLTHVFDRGYATTKMLEWLFDFEQDFIIRWKKNHLLEHTQKGQKKTHLLARSFKGRASKIVKDKQRATTKRITVAWTEVTHPEYPEEEVWLVIVRDKHNYNGPMYILTSIPVEDRKSAWEVFFSYMHRWEVEQGFRVCKSELAIQSPRLWWWENRLKLLAIVALVYDFLLQLIRAWRTWLPHFLRNYCHRTGDRYRNASIPIYRLRIAIHWCLGALLYQNSG